jgi:transposase-like protein
MLSVRKFMDRFPDDESCRELLLRLRWRHGFVCPRCGEDRHSIIKSRRLFECSTCKTQTSVTSGTVMHRTKLPLRYWLFVFYWVATGERYSARKISLTLKLNYRTAMRMLNAVRQVMGKVSGSSEFAFWLPAQHDILNQVNRLIMNRAERFIRKNYGRIATRNRICYFCEFQFRQSQDYNPKQSLLKLLRAGAASFWGLSVMNEPIFSPCRL